MIEPFLIFEDRYLKKKLIEQVIYKIIDADYNFKKIEVLFILTENKSECRVWNLSKKAWPDKRVELFKNYLYHSILAWLKEESSEDFNFCHSYSSFEEIEKEQGITY